MRQIEFYSTVVMITGLLQYKQNDGLHATTSGLKANVQKLLLLNEKLFIQKKI
jgi:hypothetical protein